jgi:hypothetical protein
MTKARIFAGHAVVVEDVGFSAGYGLADEANVNRVFRSRFFRGGESRGDFDSLGAAHARARSAAEMNGARYWIRLADGSVHIGYADDRERYRADAAALGMRDLA